MDLNALPKARLKTSGVTGRLFGIGEHQLTKSRNATFLPGDQKTYWPREPLPEVLKQDGTPEQWYVLLIVPEAEVEIL